MERLILLNPGPVTLSSRVRAALGSGDWCHREPEFAALTRDINARLARVHPGFEDFSAVTLTGSGTAAVEAMLATFAPDAATTLVLANGVYGERMARMLALHGKPHQVLSRGWTEPIDVPAVGRLLGQTPGITHVAVVHHETTTGRLNDLAALGAVCRAARVMLLVDAVSSFGAEHLDPDGWNVAALAATANKCLHGAPGLSFVLASAATWHDPPARVGSLYLDLHSYHRGQHGDGFSPFTQAVQSAFALREALAEHEEQGGAAARRALFAGRAARIAATLESLGVTPLLPPSAYSSVLWSWRLPPGISYQSLHDTLRRGGYVIYAGQGALAPDIFRIAHMGDIRESEIDRFVTLLRSAMTR